MSFAPLFTTLSASNAVKTLIGSSPVRCYPHGEAPQGVTKPYVTYQQESGSPENYLGTLPDADTSVTQVDVYADTVSSARAVYSAIRGAVEPVAYVTSVRELGRDAETDNYRISFDVDWITLR